MKSKKFIIATMVFGMAITGSAGVYAGTKLQKSPHILITALDLK